jgi:endonuclease/exonuclease/phosphatase family metal-dependent hydrolase
VIADFLRRLGRALGNLGRVALVGWLLVAVIALGAPQRAGVWALAEVFAPYLSLLVLGPALWLWRGSRWGTRGAALACALVAAYLWAPALQAASGPAPAAPRLSVINWNVEVGGDRAAIAPVLARGPADIIALLEFQGDWVEGDAAVTTAYPYRVRHLGDRVSGMMLLSRYPIRASGMIPWPADLYDQPRASWASVVLDGGVPLTVVFAHPVTPITLHPSAGTSYDPRLRDAEISAIHAYLAPALARGDRLLLIGDFNLTEREPAYHDATAGLLDAGRAAGQGPGLTWRPTRLKSWLPPILRIDYQFAGPGLHPVAVAPDCTYYGSDHCLLRGEYAMP